MSLKKKKYDRELPQCQWCAGQSSCPLLPAQPVWWVVGRGVGVVMRHTVVTGMQWCDRGGHTVCQMPAHICRVSRKDRELREKCIQRCLSSKNLQASSDPQVFQTVNQQCHLRNFLKYCLLESTLELLNQSLQL